MISSQLINTVVICMLIRHSDRNTARVYIPTAQAYVLDF